MAGIHISDIESAINFWRERMPSPDGLSLSEPLKALAEVYALMVYRQATEWPEDELPSAARQAWLGWFDTTPDTPCIAICSTARAMTPARAAGAALTRCSTGPR